MIDFNSKNFVQLSWVKDMSEVTKVIEPLLIHNEKCLLTFQALKDCVAFTNKRIIAVDAQGVTGKKKYFFSIPYSKINTFSVETSGVNGEDTKLELYISGMDGFKMSFFQMVDILQIGRVLSAFVFGDKEAQEQEINALENKSSTPRVVVNPDEWQCKNCGRVNKNYVGTCGCGQHK